MCCLLMKCPHCATSIHESWKLIANWNDIQEHNWRVEALNCPDCRGACIRLQQTIPGGGPKIHKAFPPGSIRILPKEVEGVFREDFEQASAVLSVSPKASAALSRRCLQLLLREKGGYQQKDLSHQIEAAMNSGHLPTYLAEAIDGVRSIGNFAAHPLKSQVSGEIVDVEPGEAEWLLDTLEGMFDFYVVQPAQLRAKRAALDAKLKEFGKPPVR